jgi:hypothetical protein
MKPKKGLKSRTNSLHATAAVAALVMALGAKWMPGLITVDTAALIAGALMAVFAGLGAALKADDRRKIAALPLIVGADPTATITGSERAHPRCEENRDGHRCTRSEGHSGQPSKPPVWNGKHGLGLMLALALSSCSAVTAILAPEPLACDVRANLRCSTDPATGLQVCAVYCRTRLLWRQNCDGAVIRSGRLYCGDVGVLRLPGDVSEVAQ